MVFRGTTENARTVLCTRRAPLQAPRCGRPPWLLRCRARAVRRLLSSLRAEALYALPGFCRPRGAVSATAATLRTATRRSGDGLTPAARSVRCACNACLRLAVLTAQVPRAGFAAEQGFGRAAPLGSPHTGRGGGWSAAADNTGNLPVCRTRPLVHAAARHELLHWRARAAFAWQPPHGCCVASSSDPLRHAFCPRSRRARERTGRRPARTAPGAAQVHSPALWATQLQVCAPRTLSHSLLRCRGCVDMACAAVARRRRPSADRRALRAAIPGALPG